MASDPRNELEAVVESEMNLPEIWRLEEMEALEPKVTLPEILAVPPTSNEVSVLFPALMPKRVLPVNSKLVDTETPPEKVESPVMVKVPVSDKVKNVVALS